MSNNIDELVISEIIRDEKTKATNSWEPQPLYIEEYIPQPIKNEESNVNGNIDIHEPFIVNFEV